MASGNAASPAKPGFATSSTPAKATSSGRICAAFAFSPRKSHAEITVKNGAVLLSVCASAIGMWLMA